MKHRILSAATTGLSLCLLTSADAALTYQLNNAAEPNIQDVLDKHAPGATRVDDSADQRWTGTFAVQVVGRFSGYQQDIGVEREGQYQALVEAQGMGFDATSEPVVVTLDEQAFVRSGDSGMHYSDPSLNEDTRDHVITYRVAGNDAAPVWLMFWEDLTLGPTVTKGRSSSDFNDVVVMVRTAESQALTPVAVPLPPAALTGLATLALGAFVIRRRLS